MENNEIQIEETKPAETKTVETQGAEFQSTEFGAERIEHTLREIGRAHV